MWGIGGKSLSTHISHTTVPQSFATPSTVCLVFVCIFSLRNRLLGHQINPRKCLQVLRDLRLSTHVIIFGGPETLIWKTYCLPHPPPYKLWWQNVFQYCNWLQKKNNPKIENTVFKVPYLLEFNAPSNLRLQS